jgi:hypothetical protein
MKRNKIRRSLRIERNTPEPSERPDPFDFTMFYGLFGVGLGPWAVWTPVELRIGRSRHATATQQPQITSRLTVRSCQKNDETVTAARKTRPKIYSRSPRGFRNNICTRCRLTCLGAISVAKANALVSRNCVQGHRIPVGPVTVRAGHMRG